MKNASSEPHFTPRFFTFLRALKHNNERAWFQANKERYIADVQQPMLRFIADFAEPLRKISKNFIADPKPVGGSMFRVYRDTRFSRDKTPYKTHASAHFRHTQATRNVHAPGFYLHLEPGECFIGGGIWLPEAATLKKLRDAIAYDAEGWRKVKRKITDIEGDGLTRPPQGYDPAHPFIDDLKRKSHFSHAAFSEAEVCSPRFLARCAEACRARAPLMQFLTEAVDLDW